MPIPDGMIINHKNGQKDDNRPCNLELTTYSENQKHSYENCLSDQWGEKNPSAKLSNKQVAEIRLAYSQGGYTQQQLASKYRVAFQTISNIVRGKRRQKQGGIVGDYSYRRQSGIEKDPATGRFVGKRRAGRLLDGRTWEEVPS
jgi:DNA-binding XRE family transcriptional regulator